MTDEPAPGKQQDHAVNMAEEEVDEEDFPIQMCSFQVPKNPRPKRSADSCSCGGLYYFYRYFNRLFLDCLSCAKNQHMIQRETKSKVFWLFFITAVLYGFVNWWRAEGWDLGAVLGFESPNLLYLGFARFAGTLITVSTMTLLVAINRIVTNSINELPGYRRDWFFWRSSHKFFAGMTFLFGGIHTVSHIIRLDKTPQETLDTQYGYEIWEAGTGLVLWVCLLGLAWHHIVLKFPRLIFKATRSGFIYDDNAKRFFRKYHYTLYFVYTVFYVGHTYNLWPILFLVLYQLSYYCFNLPIMEARYCFNVKGKRSHYTTADLYDLELWFTLSIDIPAQFGLYCQVVVDNVNASYTVIPDQKNSNVIHFKIRKCVLTEKFRKMLSSDLRHMHYMGAIGGGFDFRQYNINVYGPFHSSDLELANTKKLAVLTTGIGGTVAYSTVAFARGKPTYWSSLAIVHFDKNYVPRDEAIRMGVAPTDPVHCETLQQVSNMALHGSVNAPQRLVDTEAKSISDDLRSSEYGEGGVKRIVQPVFINLKGRLHASFTRDLILELHEKGFDFLVCSKIWTSLIEECNEIEPFRNEIVKSLHIEEFD
jgi:hypothetical protein